MPTRRALCIGIDDYPGRQSLSGCVNDARAWSSVLREVLGFADADVELLVNKAATKRGVIASIERLLSGLVRGDAAVITASCHGSYLADGPDADVVEFALCPYDVEAEWIPLAEVAALTRTAPAGVRLTLVVDGGFSGSATRVLTSDMGLGRTPDDRRVRYLSPALMGRPVVPLPWPRERRDIAWNALVITAARSNQYAYEAFVDGEYRGAFSRAAVDLIRTSGGKLTARQLVDQAGAWLDERGFDQAPTINGKDAKSRRSLFT